MQYGQVLDRVPIRWPQQAVQLLGAQHQEPGQQLRLWPTAMSPGLAVLLNPRCPGPGDVPLGERVLPPL